MSRRPFLLPLAHYASSYRRTVFLVDSASSDSVPSELTLGHLPTAMLSLSGWLLRVLRVPPADFKNAWAQSARLISVDGKYCPSPDRLRV